MDERIKELAKQSGLWFVTPREDLMNDFAELIVKECCQALWTDACHMSDLAVEEFNRNSRKIKRHFGVE